MSNPKLTKVAYNYVDDLLEKLRQQMDYVSKRKPFDQKAYNDLETRSRVLQQKRYSPYQDAQTPIQESQVALYKNLANTPEMREPYEDTSRMSPFHQWENAAGGKGGFQQISKVPNSDTTQPEWVSLPDLKFFGVNSSKPSQSAQYIKEQMGDALRLQEKGTNPKWPEYDTYIRGTQEAWNKFVSLAPHVFDNVSQLPTAKSLGLKGETAYNADYTADQNQPNAFPLGVQVINQNGNQDHWEVGNKKNEKAYKPGIRLSFDPADKNYFAVSNLIVQELQLRSTRTNRGGRTIDVYDIDAPKLIALSQKLQQSPYKYQVKPLNDAITSLTGKAVGDVKKKISDKAKSAPLSDKVIQNRIATNIYQTPSYEDFDREVSTMYPGVFKVSPEQQAAQKKGMYFILGRGTSILADEPGAGKTAQSMVGADYATVMQDREAEQNAAANGTPPPPKKRILVISPLPLIEEHWASRQGKQSKPELYMGHSADSVAIIRTLQDYNNIGPNVRWVVVPDSTISLATKKDKQAYGVHMRIAEDAKAGLYGASIIDELQKFKNLDSNSGEALRIAISASGIKHRIGLTGTPADNDPTDLYSQLRLTRHPILYDTAGTVQQTEKGFATQFLGGEAYANKEDSAFHRINSIFAWAKSVDKKLLIELFSTTYMRRTKDQMRSDLPTKTRANPNAIPGQEEHWNQRFEQIREQEEQKAQAHFEKTGKKIGPNPWGPFEREMAQAKIPYTVQKAIAHLQNPQNKLFIVTKQPEISVKIAQQINAALGEGTAHEVHGQVKPESLKQIVPNTFKEPNGILPGKQLPLRCVVYTMEMGAVGLNFKVANKALFNDIAWNPSDNLQAEDRIHRIDSQHPVDVEYTFFQGTYDQEMFDRVRQKEAVNAHVNQVLKDASEHPEAIADIAGSFVESLVQSLLFDIHMNPKEKEYVHKQTQALKEFMNQQAQAMLPQLQQVAASGSWYNRFKLEAVKSRHLW